jgi:hypothetical protein
MGRSILPLVAVLEAPNTNTTTLTVERPLPIRDNVHLTAISYPNHIQSCRDIPSNWPVGHPKELDAIYGPNVGDLGSLYPIRHEYAQTSCPVDADPFLPWIHDVFVDATGRNLQIVAHNKRRCRRYPKKFAQDITNLEPQVALMQSVPIQRLDDTSATTNDTTINRSGGMTWDRLYSQLPTSWRTEERSEKEHWYRLVPLEHADAHSQETRFLCQYFTLRPVQVDGVVQGVEKVIVGEKWSTFPYNYEHANFQHRRGQEAKPMLTRPANDEDFNGSM